ncbi:MAG: hypothetical protein M3R63_06025 [Actinomycetota bacterium]|nr:hypothetical protein [Actinomycetota bacterium]
MPLRGAEIGPLLPGGLDVRPQRRGSGLAHAVPDLGVRFAGDLGPRPVRGAEFGDGGAILPVCGFTAPHAAEDTMREVELGEEREPGAAVELGGVDRRGASGRRGVGAPGARGADARACGGAAVHEAA